MPISSLEDAPSLTRPHTANSVTDRMSRGLSQVRLNRGRIKRQFSSDEMFAEDVENRPGTAPNSEYRDTKLEMGGVQDLDSGFESPPSPGLKMGHGKKKLNQRAESLAALLLEADLKSLSSLTLELSDKKSRQESQNKRVAFMDHKNPEPVLELAKNDSETQLLSTTPHVSPPTLRRGERRAMHEAPDKDDEWGATDVLTMLPDGPEAFMETEAKESATESSTYDFFAKMKPPSNKSADIVMSSDFGGYQPSFLSASRRIPLAGRRRSPAKGPSLSVGTESIDTHLQAPVKSTYITLSKKPENTEITPSERNAEKSEEGCAYSKLDKVSEKVKVEEEPLLSRLASNNIAQDTHLENASLEIPTDSRDLEGTFKPRLDFDNTSVSPDLVVSSTALANREDSLKIDHVSLRCETESVIASQPAVEYRGQFKQLSLDTSEEKINFSNTSCRPNFHQDSKDDPGSNIQGFQKIVEFERLAQFRIDEEEWSSRQKAFCDVLLEERNELRLKLDMERYKFSKEKETFQIRLNDEGMCLRGEIQILSSMKEKLEAERDSLTNEVKSLREENLHLKDEILRVEIERLAFEKKICEAERSHEDFLLNKVEQEKDEAQKLAIKLTSEVQLLKNSSLLAEEKMAYLYKVHGQELQVMKSLHNQELEVKDKQFGIEKKIWSDHKKTMDTAAKLLEKRDEWAMKVEELHNALLSERKLASNDKTTWLGTMNETVNKGQATLREWGDHCNGIKNQFDQLLEVLDAGGREIRTMHLEEKERLDREHAHLKVLQETLQEERAQSLADLSASRERLEEMRSQCFFEKESFLTNCMQELKDIAAKKEAVVHMREQLLHAESALEKQIMEHTVIMQAEASEAAKQRLELERAKEMAVEIVQEVEDARQELEQQRQAFATEIASVREFGLQAEQKVELAMDIKREALQLKLDAEAIQQDSARESNEIERQRIQAAMAQKELLQLKRRHDEERMRLAMERHQLCSERKQNGMVHVSRDPIGPQGPFYSVHDSSKSHVLDLNHWEKMKQAGKLTLVPTRASNVSSNSKSALGSGPWIVESVEASLCLQAQEDFLAEASKVLQHTTQSTCKLLTKT